ncbi:DUF6301 family protein [Rhodococcus globerulus]|uniref:DUF6301 family protein n=1 Tax=Rhodococcus globerulus TaxID=33008 RepID=A0ABU4C553_RHOGO|nr:DUF6301 family protein [Rhodococcus globerulus]MDV6271404.1 DUF6301 family protein [Rhodococcus globerulus]
MDPFQPQCDATRRTDFDRSAEIFCLATEFDWTWSRDDLDRFCAAAGWTVTEHRELASKSRRTSLACG